MDVLAKRLKWLREKERYSQKEIAAKINMTASGLQKIEYGDRDPNLDVLVKLCDIYGVSADFLLGRENYTDQLQELLNKINENIKSINVYEGDSTELIAEINELREKMIEVARDRGFDDTITKQLSVKLDSKVKEYQLVQKLIAVEKSTRNDNIMSYIKELFKIPDSKPYEDTLLTRFIPYDIDMQLTIFDEAELILFGKGLGSIGVLDVIKTDGTETEVRDSILSKLNGNRK